MPVIATSRCGVELTPNEYDLSRRSSRYVYGGPELTGSKLHADRGIVTPPDVTEVGIAANSHWPSQSRHGYAY